MTDGELVLGIAFTCVVSVLTVVLCVCALRLSDRREQRKRTGEP